MTCENCEAGEKVLGDLYDCFQCGSMVCDSCVEHAFDSNDPEIAETIDVCEPCYKKIYIDHTERLEARG